MPVVRVPHSINRKRYGMFYHFDNGECLYLAHCSGESTKLYHYKSNSWCLDLDTLREAERRGCKYVGIEHKVGTNKFHYYITLLRDFFDPPSEVHTEGNTRQRRLNRYLFRICMAKYGKRGSLVPLSAATMSLR